MTFARELIALHPLVAVREAMQAVSRHLQAAFPERAVAFEVSSWQAPVCGGRRLMGLRLMVLHCRRLECAGRWIVVPS